MTPVQVTHSTPPAWTGNEYSSCNPFNCDNTRLLLVKIDHFGLYDGNGNFLKDLTIAASQEPRWSRTNPGLIYFVQGYALMSYDIVQDFLAPVHSFTKYALISGHGESDISADGDHFVFAGVRSDSTMEVFTYSLKDGQGPLFPQALPIDGLKITAANQIIISRNSDPHKPTDGIFVLESTGERRLTDLDEHACPATYNGRDVLLWAEADTVNACVMIDVETGARKTLALQLPWDYSIHISAPLNLPWCIVSTDCPDKKLPAQVWRVYFDNTIPSELICDAGSVFTGYDSEIKAAVSADGSRLVGCSNFGHPADPNYCDVFLVQLLPVQPVQSPLDPSAWTRQVLSPPGRRWGFEALANGNVQMNDVNGQTWSPIAIPDWNDYRFRQENGELVMYSAVANKPLP